MLNNTNIIGIPTVLIIKCNLEAWFCLFCFKSYALRLLKKMHLVTQCLKEAFTIQIVKHLTSITNYFQIHHLNHDH